MYSKNDKLLNKTIINYAQMKMIFLRVDVDIRNLLNPVLLIQAINHLADNKTEMGKYAGMIDANKRTWLRGYLRMYYIYR